MVVFGHGQTASNRIRERDLPRLPVRAARRQVTSRGNARQPIVMDGANQGKWLELLQRSVGQHGWKMFAFALMTNHYHLFLQTPEPNLSKGMQHLNSSFAGYFNARHGRCGHLFQGRFKAITVEDRGHWLGPAAACMRRRRTETSPRPWTNSAHRCDPNN